VFVNFLKFIHLLAVLGLIGATIFCLRLIIGKKFFHANDKQLQLLTRVNKIILALGAIALITGSLLIYPKHFTAHTPWIEAAFGFTFIFICVVLLIIQFKNTLSRPVFLCTYLFLIILLVIITQDAVRKTTFAAFM
jgi:uncharacterized membrane protein YozB (DUF420 family)